MSTPDPSSEFSQSSHLQSLNDLLARLINATDRASLVHAPSAALHPDLTGQISAPLLHPTLEATLHILNADLPSAHFLVRHMQALPAVEGMLLHSILHRIEGDFDNARAWANDVVDGCEGFVPKSRNEGEEGRRLDKGTIQNMGGLEGGGIVGFVYGGEWGSGSLRERALGFIGEVERYRKEGLGEEVVLEKKARLELNSIVAWCRDRFGDESWVDASEAFVPHSEEIRQKGEDMTSGDKGWRNF